MTQTLSKDILEGLEEIKASGRCNMNNADVVVEIAESLGYHELALWVLRHEESYRLALAHGYVVDAPVVEKKVLKKVTKKKTAE